MQPTAGFPVCVNCPILCYLKITWALSLGPCAIKLIHHHTFFDPIQSHICIPCSNETNRMILWMDVNHKPYHTLFFLSPQEPCNHNDESKHWPSCCTCQSTWENFLSRAVAKILFYNSSSILFSGFYSYLYKKYLAFFAHWLGKLPVITGQKQSTIKKNQHISI